MRGRVNDWLRSAIAHCIRVAGVVFSGFLRVRVRRGYKGALNRRHNGTEGRFAVTSGSAGDPKRILYTNKRLRETKFVFSDMFARACRAFRIRRTSLYVFSSFGPDDSLTSLLLDEIDLPNYFATLQAPYRVQRVPAIRALAAEYGATAVRLWIITISNPGVLYSTNPSTLSTFFDDLQHNWHESSALIRNWRNYPKRFNSDVRKIAHRLASTGSEKRLKAIATSDLPLPIDVWAPAVEAYICWTGGYVKPFLDRLQKHLPSTRYRLIPMYSMSTETIETLSYFQNNDVYFLPLAPGVVYEFLEEADQDHFIKPTELQAGKLYEMIVSDSYGLSRYRTGDLFLCRRKINNLPDLVFQRRRGLQYSFTGEKLTAEQVTLVFDQLRERYPQAFADCYLTCLPSLDTIPHYKVLLIGGPQHCPTHLKNLAARCDQLLGEINCEYKSKRASGRLGIVTLSQIGTKEFAETLSSRSGWESQFKFLPLCPHLIWTDTNRVS
ncbi:MAG TPA: GH3 auxin-responsive promoter family protein [Pyrinomonadaceae bacterium]|nr:GH3 auxin-responsive promoter family protein [Pyrinomonadaceae bacterium]